MNKELDNIAKHFQIGGLLLQNFAERYGLTLEQAIDMIDR